MTTRAWQAADAPTTSTFTTSSALTPTTPIKDTVEALRQLIDAGEIRHVGLSEAAPGRSAELTSCTRFETVDAEVGAAPARVALAWLPGQGDDIVPISGTKRVSRLEENAAAVDLVLSPDQLARLSAIRPSAGDRYADMSPDQRLRPSAGEACGAAVAAAGTAQAPQLALGSAQHWSGFYIPR